MPVHICKECGTSYADAPSPPARCPICEDERQYVPRTGQAWTTPAELSASHLNTWRLLEPDLFEIHTQPEFAIGQRALLVRTEAGNFLWDCIALIDDATVELIKGLGGLAGVAISHPHYYTTCQDWAAAFGCPVHLHAADREWVMRADPELRFWQGDTLPLGPGTTLIRLGGHFPGATVMHRTSGTGDGVLRVSAGTAGLILASFTLSFFCANLVAGLASRKPDRRPFLAGFAGLALAGLVGLALAPLAAPFVLVPAIAFGLGGCFTLGMTLPLDHARDPEEANAWGALVTLVAYLVAATGPLAVGALRDVAGSFAPALWLLAGAGSLLFGLTPFLRPRLQGAP